MNARAVLLVMFFAVRVVCAQDVLVSSRFSSQALRYDGATGAFKGVFASGSGIANPNGITYGPEGELGLVATSANHVTVIAYDEAGAARAAKTYRLAAGETRVLPRILEDLGAPSLALASLRVEGDVLAWAIRNESASGDPIFISAR